MIELSLTGIFLLVLLGVLLGILLISLLARKVIND